MRLQIDTEKKEIVILESVDLINLHEYVTKIAGKKNIKNWTIVTTKEIINTWYPIYPSYIHYHPLPSSSIYTTTETNISSANTIISYTNNNPMLCNFNDDETINVYDNSTELVVSN